MCTELDQLADNDLTDTHGTNNIVKYPDMLIKLIYISFLRRLHCFTLHKGEDPPRFRLDSRKLSNLSKRWMWPGTENCDISRSWPTRSLNLIACGFPSWSYVKCLVCITTANKVYWTSKKCFRCSGICYKRRRGTGLGRNAIWKRRL